MSKPTLLQRLRLATRVFRSGLPLPGISRKASPYVWPEWRRGEPAWQLTDYRTYADEGFQQNDLIYRAVMYKVRSKRLAPLRAYTGTRDNPDLAPPDHPLAKLVDRPNPHQSMIEFEDLLTVYFSIAGQCHIFLDRKRADAMPEAMYLLRPDRVYPVPDPRFDRALLGYWYVPEGKARDDGTPLRYQDIMHIKNPNPLDPLEGLGEGFSPITSGARSADVDNSVTAFLKDFFDRGLMPNVILSTEQPLTDRIVDETRRRWREIYGGREGWLEPGVVGSGLEIQRMSMTFDELGFADIDERTESRIIGPFGVPPILIGTRVGLNRSTYSNFREARIAFWEDTALPEFLSFEREYQYYLRSEDGAFVAYDRSDIPALQERNRDKVEAFKTLFDSGYPRDVAARIVSLPAPESPAGDVSWMPLNLIPSGSSDDDGGGGDEADAAEATEDERKFWRERARKAKRSWSQEQKRRLWLKIDRIAESWERRFEDAVEERMRADLRELRALVTDAKNKALARKQTVNWSELEIAWQDWYNALGEDAWRETFTPLIRGVIGDQGESWASELGIQWDVSNLDAEIWFDEYTLQFAQPINQTTLEDLHSLISQALENGWSIPEMEKQLGLTFDRYLDPDFTLGRGLTEQERQWFDERKPRYRRTIISRTETIRASNAGTTQLFDRWGVKRREWLATLDGRVRDDHAAANGQVREMGQPFEVGGHSLMYPGDNSMGAPLNQTIQCRCTVLPVIE